jgi:DNA-binding NarL/FixJ family response regulator
VIRVLLVDDHKLVRAGLQSLIDSTDDLAVAGAASDGAEALTLVAELNPDIVLMDLSMPGMDGIEATSRIVAEHPDVQVLVLTSFSDGDRVKRALDAGAVGYLLKDAEPGDLIDGVRAVARGESPLDPRAAREVLRARGAGASSGVADQPVELSPRETEVLRLVVEGLLNKQIAQRLGISERTVKAHLTSIFQRIGVADRTQAALWAQRREI